MLIIVFINILFIIATLSLNLKDNNKLTRRQGNTDFHPGTAALPWLSGEVTG